MTGYPQKKSGAIVQVSLETRDLSTASRRAPLVSAAFDDMIEGMTYTTLTRAHLRQYLESVVQAEVARIEEARLHDVNRRAILALTQSRCRRRLSCSEHPRLEQVEFGAAVHLALQGFQTVDLAFGLAV